MKKKLRGFVVTMWYFFAGVVFASLMITEDNTWKFGLPMCLICIMF
jgi:hypothetical protein